MLPIAMDKIMKLLYYLYFVRTINITYNLHLTKTVLCFISDEFKAAIDEVPFFFIWFINRSKMEKVPRDIQLEGEKSRKVTTSSGKLSPNNLSISNPKKDGTRCFYRHFILCLNMVCFKWYLIPVDPREDAGVLRREYVLRIPSVS